MNMRKRAKRVQKSRATSSNARENFLLLELNEELAEARKKWVPRHALDLPDARRLTRIVLRLQRLAFDPPELPYHWEEDRPDPSPAGHNARRLYRLLQEYAAFPYISYGAKGQWDLKWSALSGIAGKVQLTAVLIAVDLAKSGEIHKLRQCRVDKQWFFARTSDSKFCCKQCRETFHQNDPERKAKRREYMRENYRIHKTKNVK